METKGFTPYNSQSPGLKAGNQDNFKYKKEKPGPSGRGYTGFTLVELLVAVSVFSLIIGAASGIFVSAIQAQRRVLAQQELLDQTSYVMEHITRALRMAKKELNCFDPLDPATCGPGNPPACLTTAGYGFNYETNAARDKIRFLNSDYKCQEFYLDLADNRIYKSASPTNFADDMLSPLPLTSSDLLVQSFKIGPSDSWDQDDNEQPRVTIFLKARGAGAKPELQPAIQIQTTISQRDPDSK